MTVAGPRSGRRRGEQAAGLFCYHAGRGQILIHLNRDGNLYTTSFFIRAE